MNDCKEGDIWLSFCCEKGDIMLGFFFIHIGILFLSPERGRQGAVEAQEIAKWPGSNMVVQEEHASRSQENGSQPQL